MYVYIYMRVCMYVYIYVCIQSSVTSLFLLFSRLSAEVWKHPQLNASFLK